MSNVINVPGSALFAVAGKGRDGLPCYTLAAPHGRWMEHGETFMEDGACYCRVSSRRLPNAIADLRGGSPERLAAVAVWQEELYAEIVATVRRAVPSAALGQIAVSAFRTADGGRI